MNMISLQPSSLHSGLIRNRKPCFGIGEVEGPIFTAEEKERQAMASVPFTHQLREDEAPMPELAARGGDIWRKLVSQHSRASDLQRTLGILCEKHVCQDVLGPDYKKTAAQASKANLLTYDYLLNLYKTKNDTAAKEKLEKAFKELYKNLMTGEGPIHLVQLVDKYNRLVNENNSLRKWLRKHDPVPKSRGY